MLPPVKKVIIDRDRIAERVEQLGDQIAGDLADELSAEGAQQDQASRIVIIPVMVGSFMFAADLVRRLPVVMSLNLVTVSSYPGASVESKGARLRGALPDDLAGKHVVLVDDILDTGRTLSLLERLVLEQNPASLRTCVLLRKLCDRDERVEPAYIGFDVPDEFVVGYGLDYAGCYRNLPDIAVLDMQARPDREAPRGGEGRDGGRAPEARG